MTTDKRAGDVRGAESCCACARGADELAVGDPGIFLLERNCEEFIAEESCDGKTYHIAHQEAQSSLWSLPRQQCQDPGGISMPPWTAVLRLVALGVRHGGIEADG